MQKRPKVFIFLHGYNQCGEDMKVIFEGIKDIAPKGSQFLFPNAPFKIPSKNGYSWYPYVLTDFPPEIQEEIFFQSMQTSMPYIMYYLGKNIDTTLFTFEDMFFIGFSQGASFALHTGMRMPKKTGGIISFSGGLANPKNKKKNDNINKTDICLIHGTKDVVLPHQLSIKAENELKIDGFNVELHILDGAKHRITADGIKIARNFLDNIINVKFNDC